MENTNDYDELAANIEKRIRFLYEAKKYEIAMKEAEKLLECDPNNFTALFFITACYFYMKKYGEAAKIVQNLLDNYPESSDVNSLCGLVFLNNNEYEKSVKYSKKALELDPSNAEAYYVLSVCFKKKGGKENFYKAKDLIIKALEIDPNNVESHLHASGIYIDIGEYYEAKLEAEKALQLDPESVGAHDNYGNALIYLGDLDKGLDHFYESLKFNPNDAMVRNNVHLVKKHMCNTERYYRILKRRFFYRDLKINNNSKGFVILAKIYIEKKRYMDALRIFKKYLNINPTSVEEHIGYAKLLYDEGALAEALYYFKALKVRNVNNSIIDKYIETISAEMKKRGIKKIYFCRKKKRKSNGKIIIVKKMILTLLIIGVLVATGKIIIVGKIILTLLIISVLGAIIKLLAGI